MRAREVLVAALVHRGLTPRFFGPEVNDDAATSPGYQSADRSAHSKGVCASSKGYAKLSAMISRLCLSIILIAVVLSASSCAGSLFKVKPMVELPPLAGNVKTASAGGVTVRVAPLLSDEESQDLFEANLPLSGILAVRMELAFESGVPVEIKKVRFRLRDAEGREWKFLAPKAAISRILKANDVYTYNPNSRKQFEKEFTAYAIELKAPLSEADRRRQGFVFFETPKKEPVASPRSLVLSIDRLPQAVEIPLN